MTSLLAFVFVMGLLISIHELGHFIVAKKNNVAVPTFSLGFGPKIFGFTRGETHYKLSAIPFGGYVELFGEKPDQVIPPEKEHLTFRSKPPLVKFAVVFAGPAFNGALAFLLFLAIFMLGVPMVSSKIGSVEAESPAAIAGLLPGDFISSVNGKSVSTWHQVSRILNSQGEGKTLQLEVIRDGIRHEASIVPVRGEVVNKYGEKSTGWRIGIFHANDRGSLKTGFFSAAKESSLHCKEIVVLIIGSIKRLVLRKTSLDSVGGPVMIASFAGSAAKTGLLSLLSLTATLSVSFAVFNLLPIPAMDGGHILFSIIEALRGRPVGASAYKNLNFVGASFLVIFSVTVFYNDIVSFVKSRAVKEPTPQSLLVTDEKNNKGTAD